jgi:hypothetical protein
MMGGVTPTGYISLHDALRRLAKIDDYKEGDDEWFDIGDRLNDAQAMHHATQEMRQHLCDSLLTGYYFPGGGKPHPVPEGTWTEDDACLERVGPDLGLEHLWHFHRRGIQVNGVRWPVFLIESEFEKLRKGEAKPKTSMAPKIKRGRGRPKGVGGFDDELWLDKMQEFVHLGKRPLKAANEVLFLHEKEIEWEKGTDVLNVIHRLYKKYMKSDRLKEPPASD